MWRDSVVSPYSETVGFGEVDSVKGDAEARAAKMSGLCQRMKYRTEPLDEEEDCMHLLALTTEDAVAVRRATRFLRIWVARNPVRNAISTTFGFGR